MNAQKQTATRVEPVAMATLDLGPKLEHLPMVIGRPALKQEVLIDISLWAPEDLARIEEEANKYDITDTAANLSFAADAQRDLSRFLDKLMAGLKVKEAGFAGMLAIELSDGIDLIQVEKVQSQLQNGVGWLGRLFMWLGLMKNYAKMLLARNQLITEKFDQIERNGINQKAALDRSHRTMDELATASVEQMNRLARYIVLGDRIFAINQERYQARRQEVLASPSDLVAVSKLRDFHRTIQLFDTRLIRVKEAHVEAGTLTLPRIRLIQESQVIESEEIMSGILFELPRLKALVVQYAAMYELQQAQAGRKKMGEVRDRINQASNTSLEQVYTSAKESQGAALERVEDMKESVARVLDLVKRGIEIEKETAARRQQAERGLIELKDQTQKALAEMELSAV